MANGYSRLQGRRLQQYSCATNEMNLVALLNDLLAAETTIYVAMTTL